VKENNDSIRIIYLPKGPEFNAVEENAGDRRENMIC